MSQIKKSVILHVDVDAFECQVHQILRPDLHGRPVIVANSKGRITSTNYEAKRFGISRNLKAWEAQRKCSKLYVIQIPDHPYWGKPDSTMARYASWQIFDDGVLPYRRSQEHPFVVNFASTDEFFFDVTEMVTARMKGNPFPKYNELGPKTILEGAEQVTKLALKERLENVYLKDFNESSYKNYEDEAKLVYGAIIAFEIGQSILRGSKFKVSCGVGHNMLTAKLATSLNKPDGITILPGNGIERLAPTIKIEDIPGLGGERGKHLKETLKIDFMKDLQSLKTSEIKQALGSMTSVVAKLHDFSKKVKCWSYGIDFEIVQERICKETISCGKTLYEPLETYGQFYNQVGYLVEEMMERIQEEKYRSGRLPVSLRVEVVLSDDNKQLSKPGFTFEWQNTNLRSMIENIIERFVEIGFSSHTEIFKEITVMRMIVTRFKMPEPEPNDKLS